MKKNLAISLFFLTLAFIRATPLAYAGDRASYASAAKSILIQHNGRVKSFDAFALQTMERISEKETWDGKPALGLILGALNQRGAIADIRWMKINYKELVSYLGLPEERDYFSYNEILRSLDAIETLVKKCRSKRDADVRPSMLEQKAESLYERMIDVKKLMTGESVKVIPPSAGGGTGGWLSPYEIEGPPADQFKSLIQAYGEKKYSDFALKTADWKEKVHEMTGQKYRRKISLEVFYFDARPFQKAWIAYLLAVTKAGDIGAYAVGTLFGRHSLIPHISPKKSVEGMGGGLAASILASFFLRRALPLHFECFHVLVLGFLIGVVGQIGDLSESLMKRFCNAKDSGHLLPGMGGFLDAVDSILFTAPIFYFHLKIYL